jgi:hypothetical protein
LDFGFAPQPLEVLVKKRRNTGDSHATSVAAGIRRELLRDIQTALTQIGRRRGVANDPAKAALRRSIQNPKSKIQNRP